VARASRIKPDVKTASKLAKNSLSLTGKVLIHIGRPFYLLLSYSTLAFLFIAYWIGRSTRLFLTKLAKLIFAFPKIKLPKIRIPKLKIPELKPIFGIFKLKIRLFILRKIKFPPLPKISLPKLEPKLVCLLLFISFLLFTFWLTILKGLPSPKELVTRDVEVSTKIYDRNGVLLYKIYKDQNRTIVPLDQIPLHVRLATLAIEDAEFYVHPGFSVRGILRATLRNLKRGELTGGSTITQQLVKNALLSSEKTIVRKIKEIILAVGVELVFTKDQILEMYLNEVSYGGTAYGIQEAAQLYFDKDVDKLTLAEATLLAGLPKSPTKFSPFGSNPELGLARQKEVLKLMTINKYMTKEQAEAAKKEEITFAPNEIDIKAPHFVMYVRQTLVEKYGEEVVEKGGLEVITTLDYSIQKMAEEVVKQEVEKLSRLKVGNGAALVIDSATGEILAMVGSKDYFDTESDGNVNVTTRLRQPGSSIKIVNYAYALSNNYTPASILSDTSITFSVAGQPPYTPRNYDGAYRGNISLRSAFAESRNIPAVKVLVSYGVSQMLEMGQKMGITTWDDESRYGLSLTLGGGDVKLIDLAKTYATLANYGRRPEFISVAKVTNYRDKVLEENECVKTGGLASLAQAAEAAKSKCEGEQVLDPRVAFLLIDILNDNTARAPAFGTYSQLVIPGHDEVAVKTGTSNNLRDNLTVGFNQKYLVAVWVGNNDNSSMNRVASGVTGATPIWNKIMQVLLANEESHKWEVPEGLVKIPICSLTGTLPCEGCPTRLEWFLEENQPQKACNLEQIEREKKEREEREKNEESGGRILEPAARIQR
jgi:1A family penicillin-binding protein